MTSLDKAFTRVAQSNSPDFGTAKIRPLFTQAVKVVGIVKFNNEVVQDDIDRLPTYVVLSPALAPSTGAMLRRRR